MTKQLLTPDYIFESSWEVCNKVGGIYTVLSTRAKTLEEAFPGKLFFIGPDFWVGKENRVFAEDKTLFAEWREHAKHADGLDVRIGRWLVPGEPYAILVDFNPFFPIKNDIYGQLWKDFQVDSLHAYGDYDEASMFSYAAGKVVESFWRFYLNASDKVVYQAHEWMTGLGALYIKKHVPEIATIFTTHATSIGRSIAGNNKPLYDYLFAYNGDQMARELNMESKHSIEKQTAHNVDCFTTVSEITNNECRELLDKAADVVLMNGFEDDFVPKSRKFTDKRRKARKLKLTIANRLLGVELKDEDTLIVGTSGRYEFRNKGIDVFLEALNRLTRDKNLKKNVLALINVPGWVGDAREDLKERLASKEKATSPLPVPMITHWLHNMSHDQVLDMLKYLNMSNSPESKVKIIFIPCYLDGHDGIVNVPYYDAIIGNDMSVFASYYEPWGYTPLESTAFRIPTITTDLAGFGCWINSELGRQGTLKDGVKVIHHTDYNYSEVADAIKDAISEFSRMSDKEIRSIRSKAAALSEKALWKHFIKYYYQAYDIAIRKAQLRQKDNKQ